MAIRVVKFSNGGYKIRRFYLMWSKLFLCSQNIFLQADKSTLDVRLEIFMYKVKIASLWIDGKNCNELKTLTIHK